MHLQKVATQLITSKKKKKNAECIKYCVLEYRCLFRISITKDHIHTTSLTRTRVFRAVQCAVRRFLSHCPGCEDCGLQERLTSPTYLLTLVLILYPVIQDM